MNSENQDDTSQLAPGASENIQDGAAATSESETPSDLTTLTALHPIVPETEEAVPRSKFQETYESFLQWSFDKQWVRPSEKVRVEMLPSVSDGERHQQDRHSSSSGSSDFASETNYERSLVLAQEINLDSGPTSLNSNRRIKWSQSTKEIVCDLLNMVYFYVNDTLDAPPSAHKERVLEEFDRSAPIKKMLKPYLCGLEVQLRQLGIGGRLPTKHSGSSTTEKYFRRDGVTGRPLGRRTRRSLRSYLDPEDDKDDDDEDDRDDERRVYEFTETPDRSASGSAASMTRAQERANSFAQDSIKIEIMKQRMREIIAELEDPFPKKEKEPRLVEESLSSASALARSGDRPFLRLREPDEHPMERYHIAIATRLYDFWKRRTPSSENLQSARKSGKISPTQHLDENEDVTEESVNALERATSLIREAHCRLYKIKFPSQRHSNISKNSETGGPIEVAARAGRSLAISEEATHSWETARALPQSAFVSVNMPGRRQMARTVQPGSFYSEQTSRTVESKPKHRGKIGDRLPPPECDLPLPRWIAQSLGRTRKAVGVSRANQRSRSKESGSCSSERSSPGRSSTEGSSSEGSSTGDSSPAKKRRSSREPCKMEISRKDFMATSIRDVSNKWVVLNETQSERTVPPSRSESSPEKTTLMNLDTMTIVHPETSTSLDRGASHKPNLAEGASGGNSLSNLNVFFNTTCRLYLPDPKSLPLGRFFCEEKMREYEHLISRWIQIVKAKRGVATGDGGTHEAQAAGGMGREITTVTRHEAVLQTLWSTLQMADENEKRREIKRVLHEHPFVKWSFALRLNQLTYSSSRKGK